MLLKMSAADGKSYEIFFCLALLEPYPDALCTCQVTILEVLSRFRQIKVFRMKPCIILLRIIVRRPLLRHFLHST